MQESMSILEFQRRFQTEGDCLDAIVHKRWPNGFKCPKCSSSDAYKLMTRRVFQCKGCRHQTSITAGTIFHKTRIPLVHWFFMIFFVAQDKRGASALRLSKLLEMRYDTAWHILQKIKMAMGSRDRNITLSGFIEIDEGFFGGASKGRGNRGRGSKKKQPVIVMDESFGNRAGRLKMQIIRKVNMPEIRAATQGNFDPNCHFKADGWGAYRILSADGHKVQIKPMTKDELEDGHH